MLKSSLSASALGDDEECPPQILRYYNAWVEDEHLYIQTELCDGTLDDFAFKDNLRAQYLRHEKKLALMLRQVLPDDRLSMEERSTKKTSAVST